MGKIGPILEMTAAGTVYFTGNGGKRGAILILEIEEPSMVPALAEPWFLTFNADVDFQIVMSSEELGRAGFDDIAVRWQQEALQRCQP